MSANDHLQQAQYLLNFYESDTPLRGEYDRDIVRALRSYRSQFSELPINNPSLPYGDLLEKSSKQLKAVLHKWSTAEERYRREDTSTTTGGPSNRADELTEAARRDREETSKNPNTTSTNTTSQNPNTTTLSEKTYRPAWVTRQYL
jgi:hypothetical protein